MTKYGADGYVIEVSLTTVKVQNLDKTITTIPPTHWSAIPSKTGEACASVEVAASNARCSLT